MRRSVRLSAALFMAAALAGCNGSGGLGPPFVPPQNVYWSLFNNNAPQLEATAFPLTNASTVSTTVNKSIGNQLDHAEYMLFDSSGRLWVLNFENAPRINVFTLPLTAPSTPTFTLTFSDIGHAFGFIFDGSGNLWISDADNNRVFKYTGPFSSNATLTAAGAATTLTLGLNRPEGLAFDQAGDLFVANEGIGSPCVGSVAKFSAPISNSAPALLNGAENPYGLTFDAAGNLYVASSQNVHAGCSNGILRYNAGNFSAGATPNTVDATGLIGNYFGDQLAIDSLGNLYWGDCGSNARIYVYPSVATQFSSSLAPVTTFTDANITSTNCVGGVAIR
jgi:hypothetical protein